MFSTEDLKTAIGATVIARRNAAARLREAGNPRNPFRALPGMEQQFFEAAQSVRSYDLVLNLLEREVKREARKRAGRTAQSAAVFLITAGLIILATLGFAAALLLKLQKREVILPESIEISIAFEDDTVVLHCSFRFAEEDERRELDVIIGAVSVEVVSE